MAEKEIVEAIKKDLDLVLSKGGNDDSDKEVVDNAIKTLFSLTQPKLNDEASSSSSSVKDGDDSEEVKELKEDLEEVVQALAKGGNDDDDDDDDYSRKDLVDEAIQTMLSLSKLNRKNNNESAQIHDFEKLLEWIKDGDNRVSVKPPPVLRPVPTISDDMERDQDYETLKSLLKRLPSPSPKEDKNVLTELHQLTGQSYYARFYLGRDSTQINKLLSQYSGVNKLQNALSSILSNVCIDEPSKTNVLRNCPAALPFLIKCLKNPKANITAASALSRLSALESNRKVIGESGAIKTLIWLVKEGEKAAVDHATGAIWRLCMVAENRERAVSEGVIAAVMDKIRRRLFFDRMLQILETVSRNERAIRELEDKDILECLFMLLIEDADVVSEKAKEFCMLVIHTVCNCGAAKTRKVDEVENGRRILESLANNGTTEAAEKACDLLWNLDLLDLTNRMFSK